MTPTSGPALLPCTTTVSSGAALSSEVTAGSGDIICISSGTVTPVTGTQAYVDKNITNRRAGSGLTSFNLAGNGGIDIDSTDASLLVTIEGLTLSGGDDVGIWITEQPLRASTVNIRDVIMTAIGGSAGGAVEIAGETGTKVNLTSVTMSNCTFRPGLYVVSATVTMTGSSITGNPNTSSEPGGSAIRIFDATVSMNATSSITGNSTSASVGGAVQIISSESFSNSGTTIPANTASTCANGILLASGSCCTVAGNGATVTCSSVA